MPGQLVIRCWATKTANPKTQEVFSYGLQVNVMGGTQAQRNQHIRLSQSEYKLKVDWDGPIKLLSYLGEYCSPTMTEDDVKKVFNSVEAQLRGYFGDELVTERQP